MTSWNGLSGHTWPGSYQLMNPETFAKLRRAISHALTMHDAKQKERSLKNRRHYYNPSALPLYYQALQAWEDDKRTASNPLATLPNYFTTQRDEGKVFSIPSINKAIAPFVGLQESSLVRKLLESASPSVKDA